MKNLNLSLATLFLILSFSGFSQDRSEVQPMAEEYVDLLLKRDFEPASKMLHMGMSYVLKYDEWITAQESTVNEDMSMRSTVLDIENAEIVEKTINERTYFLYSVPEEVIVRVESDELGDVTEIMAEIIPDFQQQYGMKSVFKNDDRSIRLERQHQFIIAATAGETPVWRIFDFPNGSLDLAYGLLPAGVWDAFFPDQGLSANLTYQQAVPQTVGYYFHLLQAKAYEAAATKTATQASTPGFMAWYKSLDSDQTELTFYNYSIATPVQEAVVDNKRYAGFSVKWTLMLSTTEDASSQDIAAVKKRIEEEYPNTEIIYDDMMGMFLWHHFTPVIAIADPGQNNWMLLLGDDSNGMSIKGNIPTAVIQAVGLD